MKIHWRHVTVPLVIATVSGWLGSVNFWDGIKAPLLTCLSVIAAGVLVRLARGMPFTNTNGFDLEFARKVASAVKTSIRSLRTLLTVIFFTMGIITFSSVLGEATELLLAAAGLDAQYTTQHSDMIVSALIGGLLCYVFVRIFSVIDGDVGLADMQADIIVTMATKSQSERFSPTIEAVKKNPISNPVGYGKII